MHRRTSLFTVQLITCVALLIAENGVQTQPSVLMAENTFSNRPRRPQKESVAADHPANWKGKFDYGYVSSGRRELESVEAELKARKEELETESKALEHTKESLAKENQYHILEDAAHFPIDEWVGLAPQQQQGIMVKPPQVTSSPSDHYADLSSQPPSPTVAHHRLFGDALG